MIAGVKIVLAGTEYEVPPLSLGALERLQDRIAAFDGTTSKANVATVIDCLHCAIKRNYPDMTREQAADLIDITQIGDVMRAVMGSSGMNRGDPGNAQAPSTGEASTHS